jgi:hypothetical protein
VLFPFLIDDKYQKEESSSKTDGPLSKSNKFNKVTVETGSKQNSSKLDQMFQNVVTKTTPKVAKASTKPKHDVPMELQQRLFVMLKEHRLSLVNPSLHLHAANIFSDTALWEVVRTVHIGYAHAHYETGIHQNHEMYRREVQATWRKFCKDYKEFCKRASKKQSALFKASYHR